MNKTVLAFIRVIDFFCFFLALLHTESRNFNAPFFSRFASNSHKGNHPKKKAGKHGAGGSVVARLPVLQEWLTDLI